MSASARQNHDGSHDQRSHDGFGLLGLGMICAMETLDLAAGDGWLVVIFGSFLFILRRDGCDVGVGGMGDAIDTVPSPLSSSMSI